MSATMKFLTVAGLSLRATARLQVAGHGSLALAGTALPATVHYGDSRCPCIGFDNIEGDTMLEFEHKGEKMEVAYPADLGARCAAWDDGRHLECKAGGSPGSGAGWCAQTWCYVDPCSCDIDVLPKVASLYNTEASFRGKPLFWSYATCGGKDMFTEKVPEVGSPKCRCIGFAGVTGTTEISFAQDETVEFSAEMGSSCQSWDLQVHPDCKGVNPPSWCRASWCYVDPCDCDLPGGAVPKVSAYLPEATFRGMNVYFSYETCGSADTWTEDHHRDACENQATQEDCGKLPRCSWTGERCMGSELVNNALCKVILPPMGSHGTESSGKVSHGTESSGHLSGNHGAAKKGDDQGHLSGKYSLLEVCLGVAATIAVALTATWMA